MFGRLFGRNKEKKALSLGDAAAIARKRLEEADFPGADEARRSVREQLASVKAMLGELEKAQMPEKIDPRLRSAAQESRHQLAMHMRQALDGVTIPDTPGYAGLYQLVLNLNRGLSSISTGNLKHSYYTSMIFRQQMAGLGKEVTALASLAESLNASLERAAQENAPYKRLLDDISEKELLEKETKDISASLGDLKQAKARFGAKAAVPDIDESQLRLLEQQRQDVESEIYSLLAVLSRPLRKYAAIGGLDKPVAALVQAYIDDPVKAALSDDGKRIRQIAADLDKFIASGHIEVKSADKATASIRRILDGDLDAALAKHLDVCSRIETEQRRIAPLLRQKADAEERIKADRENEARLASEISELEGSLSQKQKALEEKAAQLKSDLDGFPQ